MNLVFLFKDLKLCSLVFYFFFFFFFFLVVGREDLLLFGAVLGFELRVGRHSTA
jgi:hypothetical protein